MLISAATEQQLIRGGTEVTLQDVARAVTLVTPDLSPIRVEVQTIESAVPTFPHLHTASADTKLFYDKLFTPEGHGDDALLPAAIAALDKDLFSFRSVRTSWSWRSSGNAITQLLRNTGGASFVKRSPHMGDRKDG
jgi:hypothetical protein